MLLAFTLLAALTGTTLASDVYAHFANETKDITATSFDVGNDGCFAVPGAEIVYFSQAGNKQTADGPYGLSGWDRPACQGNRVDQGFANVGLNAERYGLNVGVGNAASYYWKAQAC